MKKNSRDYGKFDRRFFAAGGAVDDDEIDQAIRDQIIPGIVGKAAGAAIGQAVAGASSGSAPARAAIGKVVGRLAAPKVVQAVRQRSGTGADQDEFN